ncbi:hypothetical protein [Ilumatobacter coccineus]|nr:hypothetical protein [Ilumatobacter coccineus]
MVRARSFGSIRKLPSGKYQARYWHLGKQIAADHTFAAKTDARRWLSTVEADIVRGDWVDPDAGKITFGEYANWWIEQSATTAGFREPVEGGVGAWGTAPFGAGTRVARQRIAPVVDRLDACGLEVRCVDQTSEGEPRHLPLRGAPCHPLRSLMVRTVRQ